MTRRVSFTDLISEPIEARFTPDGPWWKFPGDIPLTTLAHIEAYRERVAENGDDPDATGQLVEQLRGDVVALFRVHHPDIESFEELPCTLPQALTLVTRLYFGDTDNETEGEARPTRTTTSRGARSSTKTPSRSGS